MRKLDGSSRPRKRHAARVVPFPPPGDPSAEPSPDQLLDEFATWLQEQGEASHRAAVALVDALRTLSHPDALIAQADLAAIEAGMRAWRTSQRVRRHIADADDALRRADAAIAEAA